jgi:septal ring factor EnvC (AmiA/AmiB activator)
VLLNRLLTEVRAHERKVKDELRRADETIAHLRSDLEHERVYSSRVKKEREQARSKLEDALAEVDTARHELAELRATLDSRETSHKRKLSDVEANLADALRKKNRERVARDAEVKKQTTMDLQRNTEKALNTVLEKCEKIFAASGVQFDAEASSSEDEGASTAPGRCVVAPTAERAAAPLKTPELPIAAPVDSVAAAPEPQLPVSAATAASDSSSSSSESAR